MPEQPKYYVEVFLRDFEGKLRSCGKYETSVENFTLCVDVPNDIQKDLAKCPFQADCPFRQIHLKFSGKVS